MVRNTRPGACLTASTAIRRRTRGIAVTSIDVFS
jgi:hypothetical protein